MSNVQIVFLVMLWLPILVLRGPRLRSVFDRLGTDVVLVAAGLVGLVGFGISLFL